MLHLGRGREKIFLECNDFELDELKEVLMLLACKGYFSLDDFNGWGGGERRFS